MKKPSLHLWQMVEDWHRAQLAIHGWHVNVERAKKKPVTQLRQPEGCPFVQAAQSCLLSLERHGKHSDPSLNYPVGHVEENWATVRQVCDVGSKNLDESIQMQL